MSIVTRQPTLVSEAARSFLRFHLVSNVGPVRLRRLIEHFGSVDEALAASRSQLQRVEGVGPVVSESIVEGMQSDSVEQEIDRATSLGVRILCWDDADYPKPLAHTPDPPICLYVRGELRSTDSVAIGIVGTRRCSYYGREQARRFAEGLARAGFTIVSGLARGIDGHAHQASIRAGGRTVAVLGNGLSQIYPQEHESLACDIAGCGALLSEYPMDRKPEAQNFPPRNRIIAGMSLGVIIVEGGQRSGALITARLATEYNREVFAIPGRVDQPATAAGTNALIRDGQAKLITNVHDVLDELGNVGEIMGQSDATESDKTTVGVVETKTRPAVDVRSTIALPAGEEAVVRAIRAGAHDVEAICEAGTIDAGRVAAYLTSLEIKGLIVRLPGNRFEIRS